METYREANNLERFDPGTWRGKNSFVCNGRVYAGPPSQQAAVVAAHSLLGVLLVLFSVFEVPYLSRRYSPLVPVPFYILLLVSWGMLLLAEFTDPGALLSTFRGE